MHEKRYDKKLEDLRSPARLVMLDVQRVAQLALEKFHPESVLDVGTGTGIFAEAFTRLGMQVTGVDANLEMVEAAREHVPQARFIQAAAEAIPEPNNSFDLVFMGHVLHETDDPVRALSEARRIARRGVVVLEWPYRDEPLGPPLSHRLHVEDVSRLAHEAGFQGFGTIHLTHMMFYYLVQ